MVNIATTGIWKIESRLDHVINYIMDIRKTFNTEFGKALYDLLHICLLKKEDNIKNEKQCYVTGINCCVESAYEEMGITKQQYNKTKGILGFHAFQSFREGDVTPEQAHMIGVKLAEEMWGDRFEVVVATHLNTKKYHNHFVINSVSFKDGKKYYDNHENYAKLRHLSDSLCEEYSLSVLEEKPCKRSGINYSNYYNNYVEHSNYHTTAKEDLDRAIGQAYSYKDFEKLMGAMGYEIFYRGKKSVSIRREPYKKNIRLERSFGSEYSIERINERIETTHAIRIPFIEVYNNKIEKELIPYKKQKHKGLYGIFLYYCYLLKTFPKQYPYYPLPPEIRADIKFMEEISKQTDLLMNNKITTKEQFVTFRDSVDKKLNDLLDKRSKLWYQHKKVKSEEEKENINEEISILRLKIKVLKEKLRICNSLETRIEKIENNINEFEIKLREEVEKDEHVK